jgi:pimeloyl-ACP methyl ester carboxylesterase
VALRRNEADPLCRLIRFDTKDGVSLAGLLFAPKRRTAGAVIFIHGTGGSSVFESKRTARLGEAFTRHGIAFFPFNNRGAQVIRRAGAELGGFGYERIRDCVFDLDAAIRELRARGYRDITLVGHSTGANKIAVYNHLKPRNFATRFVLLGGGDDTGLLYAQLGAVRFRRALLKAREQIRARRGEEIVPPGISKLPMSWRSFYDMANPDGDYNVFPFLEVMKQVRLSRRPRFRFLRELRKPSLFLYGENDEYCFDDVPRCVAILDEALGPKPNVELAILGGADHGFTGKEEELADVIVNWMGM